MSSRGGNIAGAVLLMLAAQVAYGATMNDELLVDPTAPLRLPVAVAGTEEEEGGIFDIDLFGAFTSYELSSVLIRAEDRIAVINETRVRVGDAIGSATVASIEADQVTLNIDGEIQTLELYGNSIKTPVQGDD